MIEIKNLYAGYAKEHVLKNISLSFDENVSIIGPNGCGKTTLLRCLAGVLKYDGQIDINGVSLTKLKGKTLAKKVAMLSQMSMVSFNYSVLDTVLMGRFAHAQGMFSIVSKSDKEKACEAINTVGLAGIENKSVDCLSGGQLQRVFLAKIICQEPDIILLDEPTNHLDLSYQVELTDFILDWAEKNNKQVIGVLHDINLAFKLSKKLLLLNEGEVLSYGSINEIVNSGKLNEAYGLDVKDYMLTNLGKWKEL